jgi:DNA-binding transcriptional ArsR family regulator
VPSGIRFKLGPDAGPACVRVVSSPAYEAALSMHVLADPRLHAVQHNWVRRARRLPVALRRRLEAFRFAWILGPPDFMLPIADAPDFGAELARLRNVPTDLVAFEFLRQFWDHAGDRDRELLRRADVREHVSQQIEIYGGDRALAMLLFDGPDELRETFLSLLEDYWDSAFAEEWETLEPDLVAAKNDDREQIERDGIYTLLPTLGRRLLVDEAQHEFGIEIVHQHRVAVTEENPLTLLPSAFVWPGVRVNCDAPFPLTLIYPARFVARSAKPPAPSPQLLRVLRALGDETRLRALKLIAEKPRSTQELAALLPMSEAGLSKHLSALGEAGLVTTHREGYYVLYSLAPGALEALPGELQSFLSR